MARFDVYRHPDPELRRKTPFLLDVQNSHLNQLATRVVIPLRGRDVAPLPLRDLHPLLEVQGKPVVLDTTALAAFPAAALQSPVANLKASATDIVTALDTLFGSY